MKNFLQKVRIPIKHEVEYRLGNQKYKEAKGHYDSIVIGAGCSGLYSAYRLNKALNPEN